MVPQMLRRSAKRSRRRPTGASYRGRAARFAPARRNLILKSKESVAALPEVEKYIRYNGGQRLAGGFNKAKLVDGTGAVGNRYVIVSWPNAAAFEKAQSDGLKAWIDKHGNGARQIMVEGVEPK